MISTERDFEYLTLEQAKALNSASERDFALRCLAVGCLLVHQIPVGSSVIDFLVINPKRYTNAGGETRGKLVEVTQLDESPERQINSTNKRRKSRNKNKIKQQYQKTKARKERQVDAMRSSGHPWTILYNEQLKNMKRAARAKR
ncbi:MAG TPA: hypothetical protein PKJ26_03540 [Candidatus Woesebacteria bacterium]|nr:hypothetical protein [Candidatus Woesebacteria bacterium]